MQGLLGLFLKTEQKGHFWENYIKEKTVNKQTHFPVVSPPLIYISYMQ
jgi:hypothetical protein